MSLKSIEMQFALHKNDEAGLKQHQLMNKPVQDQTVLSNEAEKHTLKERQVAAKAEETNGSTVKDDGPKRQHGQEKRRRDGKFAGQSGARPKPRRDHPFKGQHIDLSL